jgi:hypothetical protein
MDQYDIPQNEDSDVITVFILLGIFMFLIISTCLDDMDPYRHRK